MDRETFETVVGNINDNRIELFRKIVLDEIRWDIYMFLLSRNTEDEYFDLTKYIDKLEDIDYIKPVFNSLGKSGWKWELSFGDTALFIFKGEKPVNCW
jgi:hypothetical protein